MAELDTPKNPGNGPEHQDSRDNFKKPSLWRKLDTWRFVAEIFILIVTIRIACIYNNQLSQMVESNRTAQRGVCAAQRAAKAAENANVTTKEALVSVQRAYVFTDSAEILAVSDENGKTIADILPVKLENSGSTPTRGMKAHINWKFFPGVLPKDFRFPDMSAKDSVDEPIVLGPKGSRSLITDPISTGVLEAVRLHQLHLYLWGWAKYRDIFDDTPIRLTEFCYDVSVVQGGRAEQPVAVKGWIFEYTQCVPHNCYDEECSDYVERTKKPPSTTTAK
jgi:hypothetical protein